MVKAEKVVKAGTGRMVKTDRVAKAEKAGRAEKEGPKKTYFLIYFSWLKGELIIKSQNFSISLSLFRSEPGASCGLRNGVVFGQH